MNLEIVTGKSWHVSAQRLSAGVPVPFVTGDTLRAQLRSTPAGAVLVTITAAITSMSDGTYGLTLTDEQTATLPEPRQFGAVSVVWLDVDIVRGSDILPTVVNEKVFVLAGVTIEEVVP